MTIDFSLQDVAGQLGSDLTGTYKHRLLQYLNQQKDNLHNSKQQLLPPQEYAQIEYLERAVDAAVSAVSECSQSVKNTRSEESTQEQGFKSIFNL